MTDPIDRQALLQALCNEDGAQHEYCYPCKTVLDVVNAQPPAQPERKTGTWIFVRDEEAGNALYMCSECGKGDIHAPEVKVSYCWNCGAQMEEEA